MSEVQEQNASRAREDRNTEIKEVRRKRKSANVLHNSKLDIIDPAFLDLKKFRYRWVNDEGNRVHNMHNNDYNHVDVNEIPGFKASAEIQGAESDTRLSVLAGSTQYGKPLRAYLMKKRREWWESDLEEEVQIRADEINGVIHGGDFAAVAGTADTTGMYAKDGNQIGGAVRRRK